jgi:hypothetical protein
MLGAENRAIQRWSIPRAGAAGVLAVVMLSAGAAACVPFGSPARGAVVGEIRFEGGPNPTALIKERQPGRVRLLQDDTLVASAFARSGHTFRLSAPPGNYQLDARSGDAMCRSQRVTIQAEGTRHTDVICDVR